jgi:hypothetical protein
MGKINKKVKDNRQTQRNKIPRSEIPLTSYQNESPSWKICSMDMNGRWGWKKLDYQTLIDHIIPQMKNFETMKWNEILNRNSHEVSTSLIIPDAYKRLIELSLDEFDYLVSMRLSGKMRLWGIRNKSTLRVLWWDPLHEICPSSLKHT